MAMPAPFAINRTRQPFRGKGVPDEHWLFSIGCHGPLVFLVFEVHIGSGEMAGTGRSASRRTVFDLKIDKVVEVRREKYPFGICIFVVKGVA